MIVMALDHVRDFFTDQPFTNPTNLNETTPGLFLTRWITHYCAPVFIFLAGTGAYLYGSRRKSKSELAWFLLTRGLWLLFLELTVVRLSWMFNWSWYEHGGGVFWAIGWAMVALSGLVFLPTSAVAIFGVALIALHNLLDHVTAEQIGLPKWLWVILHQPGGAPVFGHVTFGTAYSLIPWLGVMAAGYGFGSLLRLQPPVRRKTLFVLGAAVTIAFLAIRGANVYGDPRPWSTQSTNLFTLFSFLNCTKYPASLCYLLMTLGPAILLLAILDRPAGSIARPILDFGRVPLFFYLLHVPLIHGGAVLLDVLRFGYSPQALAGPWELKKESIPAEYGLSLPMVYLVWISVILMLYPLCHWFANVRRRHPNSWLSYL
jgi:uncharacterized membrane protein